jgi:hypothetical protein
MYLIEDYLVREFVRKCGNYKNYRNYIDKSEKRIVSGEGSESPMAYAEF